MNTTFSTVFGAAILAMLPSIVSAQAQSDALRQLAEQRLSAWASNDIIISAVQQQNAANSGLSQADIDAMDQTWRSEVKSSDRPSINSVLSRAASTWLNEQKRATAGLVTEVFVMDNQGLNVAQSDITSDLWQGDEAKWQETFGTGAGAIHIGDVELDESTQTFQSQVSMTISDPGSGDVIGAITFGINLDYVR